jgi:alpha-tubulin suppressor-like RCC1 family protein
MRTCRSIITILILAVLLVFQINLSASGTEQTEINTMEIDSLQNRIALGNVSSYIINEDGSLWAAGKLPDDFCEESELVLGDCIAVPPKKIVKFGKIKYVNSNVHQGSLINDKGDMFIWNDQDDVIKMGTIKEAVQVIVHPDLERYEGYILKKDGTVWEWFGESNKKNTGKLSLKFTFKKSSELSSTKKIRVGGSTFMALKYDGSVWAWGNMDILWSSKINQQKYKAHQESLRPTQLKDIPAINDFEMISGYPLMITDKGDLWSYVQSEENYLVDNPKKIADGIKTVFNGSNYIMDMGGNYTRWKPYSNSFYDVAFDMTDIIYISQNLTYTEDGDFVLGVKNDGSVIAWGDNKYGQLGLRVPLPLLKEPYQLGTIQNPQSVSVSDEHVLAVTVDGSLYGWGNNEYNQIDSSPNRNILIPKKIDLSNVIQAEAGRNFSLALTNEGKLFGWGRIEQLGFPNNSNQPIEFTNITDSIKQVSVLEDNIVLMTNTGDIYQLERYYGLKLEESKLRKIAVKDVIKLSGGDTKSYALSKDGSVWWWKTLINKGEVLAAKKIDGFFDIVDITSSSLNNEYLIAVDSKGLLWGWGDNTARQIGFSTPSVMHNPTNITHEPRNLYRDDSWKQDHKFKVASADHGDVYYLTDKNELFGTSIDYEVKNKSLTSNVTYIKAGDGIYYWVTGNKLYVHGYMNKEGQYGNGTIQRYDTPKYVMGIEDWFK